MPFQFTNSDDFNSDHYVAFLSSGTNASAPHQLHKNKKRGSKLGSRLAKLSAIVIGVIVTVGTVLLFYSLRYSSLHGRSDLLEDLASPIESYAADSIFGQGYFFEAFEEFIVKHEKKYPTLDEKKRRREIFTSNLLFINLHNAQNFTYTLALNEFADLTANEFAVKHFTGYRKRQRLTALQDDDRIDYSLLDVEPDSVPASINWKDKGCVTKVRDQKKCGSCWAFSAGGAVEGAYCVATGKLVSLSEQQMVDCAGPEGNAGCDGGEMDDAFQYIIDHGGLCTEDAYPYTGKDDACKDSNCSEVVKVSKFADVPRRSEKALKAAVALKGPVAVAIQADQSAFRFYHSGVFDESCGTNLNHGVLVVGYDTEAASDKDYWLIKNSWGTGWGEKGFIRLSRSDGSRSGKCGVLLDASYPIVATENVAKQ